MRYYYNIVVRVDGTLRSAARLPAQPSQHAPPAVVSDVRRVTTAISPPRSAEFVAAPAGMRASRRQFDIHGHRASAGANAITRTQTARQNHPAVVVAGHEDVDAPLPATRQQSVSVKLIIDG